MRRIFISYRRGDSADVTGRIYDKLADHYGPEQLFKDVDNIPLGIDFQSHLSEQIRECEVCIVIVGPGWLGAGDGEKRRLDDPADFVRIEVSEALARDIPVVPLLVRDAKMPALDELPESLKALAHRNGTVVRPDPDFHGDMDRVIDGLSAILPSGGAKDKKSKRGETSAERPQSGVLEAVSTRTSNRGRQITLFVLLVAAVVGGLAFGGVFNNDDAADLDIVWTIPSDEEEWLRSRTIPVQGTFNPAVKEVVITANGNNLEIVGSRFQGTVEAMGDGELPVVLQATGQGAARVRIVRTVRIDANSPTLTLYVPDGLIGVGTSASEVGVGTSALEEARSTELSEKEHSVTGTVDEYPVSVKCSRPEVSIVVHPSSGPTGPTCGFTATVMLKEGDALSAQFWAIDDSGLESRRAVYEFQFDRATRSRSRHAEPSRATKFGFDEFRDFADEYLNPLHHSADSVLRVRLAKGVDFGSGLSMKLDDLLVRSDSYLVKIETTAPPSSRSQVLSATRNEIVTFLMSKAPSETVLKALNDELRQAKYIKVAFRE